MLVNQTFIGAINLQNGSSLSNEEWIAKVASKGGTTERALEVFDTSHTEAIITNAVTAANERALELGM